jgi:hypothetical protein
MDHVVVALVLIAIPLWLAPWSSGSGGPSGKATAMWAEILILAVVTGVLAAELTWIARA